MWVFPGGKIDESDYTADADANAAARNAAVRETQEEAGITIPSDDFIWFSHWTPPPSTPKRFATWFFVSPLATEQTINIDGGEIQNHQWINPASALTAHANVDIDLAPPTWVSLYHLSRFDSVKNILDHFSNIRFVVNNQDACFLTHRLN